MRRRGLRWIIGLYPLAMIWSVMVTGNHWLLDIVGGVVVVGVGWVLTRGVGAIMSRTVTRLVEPRPALDRPVADTAADQPIGSSAILTSAYRRHRAPRPRTTMRISNQANRIEIPAKNRTAAKNTVVST